MTEDRRQEYDPAVLLTVSALLFVGTLILFVAVIIGWQIYKSGEANTESWAALTGLIGWSTAQASNIYNARYGTSKQAETKDAVIAQQSRTAEAIATGVTAQTVPAVVDTVNVAASVANVTGDKAMSTEKQPTPEKAPDTPNPGPHNPTNPGSK